MRTPPFRHSSTRATTMIHQPPDDESAKKLCRELVTLIRDGDFDSLLARVDDIKSICVDVNDVGRTVDQDIILNLDLDKHEYDLGLAAASPGPHIYAFEDRRQHIPEGHYGRFVELLYRCGYVFDFWAIDEIVSGDNIEAFEFLVFKRLEYLRLCGKESYMSIPRLHSPTYLPEGLVVEDDNEESAAFYVSGPQSRFSFWDAVFDLKMQVGDDNYGFTLYGIGEWIFDETEKPELGGFSTRDLFECAMMGFDGHEYNTDCKLSFDACKGEIRAKLDKAAADCDLSEASVARRHYGMSHLTRTQENAVKKFIGSLSSGTSTMNDESHAIPHGKIKVVAN